MVRKGHLKVVQYLVDECQCDVNSVDRLYKKTPLHFAAEYVIIKASTSISNVNTA